MSWGLVVPRPLSPLSNTRPSHHRPQWQIHTSIAIWLTTAVWFGSRISLVSGCDGLTRPFACAAPPPDAGVDVSGSTMKAPWTLILTLPGRLMVLSISSVDVIVRRRRFSGDGCCAGDVAVADASATSCECACGGGSCATFVARSTASSCSEAGDMALFAAAGTVEMLAREAGKADGMGGSNDA